MDVNRGDGEARAEEEQWGHIWPGFDEEGDEWDFSNIGEDSSETWPAFDGALDLPDLSRPHFATQPPPRPPGTLSSMGQASSSSTNPQPANYAVEASRQRDFPRSPPASFGQHHRPSRGFGPYLARSSNVAPSQQSSSQHSDSFDGMSIDEMLASDEELFQEEDEEDMPRTTTYSDRQNRHDRTSHVDLTNDSSPPRSREPRSLKRAAEASHASSSKRSRHASPDPKVEELDLTNEAPSAEEELAQSRQAALIAQQQQQQDAGRNGQLKIGKRQCIICMENFTDCAITHCGHIYCNECLFQALKAGEKNNDRGVSNCPVCRKPVKRKGQNQVVLVNFMTKAAFKGRRELPVMAT